jgi:hypothetical protein
MRMFIPGFHLSLDSLQQHHDRLSVVSLPTDIQIQRSSYLERWRVSATSSMMSNLSCMARHIDTDQVCRLRPPIVIIGWQNFLQTLIMIF